MIRDMVRHLFGHAGQQPQNGKQAEKQCQPDIELASWWRFHIEDDLRRLGIRCCNCLQVPLARLPAADGEHWLLDVSAGCSKPATLALKSHLAQRMAAAYKEAGADEEFPDSSPCRMITKIRVYNPVTGEERKYWRDLGVRPPR